VTKGRHCSYILPVTTCTVRLIRVKSRKSADPCR
jgi:hypothetical protein